MARLEDYLYYTHSLGYVFCGDSLEILPLLKKESVDLIFIDPPYNLRDTKDYSFDLKGRKAIVSDNGAWDSQFDPKDYEILFTLLKQEGNFATFTSDNLFGSWFDVLKSNLERVKTFVWYKTNPTPQVRKVSFLSACELILMGWNIKHYINFIDQTSKMHNHYSCGVCSGKERTTHKTQKPLKLIEHIINILSKEGGVVLDCFAGSGTVGVACVGLNRRFVLIEKEKEYCEIIKQRLIKELIIN